MIQWQTRENLCGLHVPPYKWSNSQCFWLQNCLEMLLQYITNEGRRVHKSYDSPYRMHTYYQLYAEHAR